MPLRDPKTGRFTSKYGKIGDLGQEQEFTLVDARDFLQDEQPLKIPRLVRMAIWLSHNRFEVGYVLLCFLAGAIGGYLGARYGLHL